MNKQSLWRGNSGASMLEFTIVLLFALPLLSATIDYGFGLRRLGILSQAAKLATREASASRAFALCNSPSGGSGCIPTQYAPNGDVVAVAQIDSLACFAEVTARDFFMLPAHRKKVPVEDYEITTTVTRAPLTAGVEPLVIDINIARKPGTTGCTFCYAHLFRDFTDTAVSSMGIVGGCTL